MAFAAVALTLSSTMAPAEACPKCAPGVEARRQVWTEDFGRNLAVALLPFVIIGAICVRVERIGRPPRERARSGEETDS
jgi:hypothetical protein